MSLLSEERWRHLWAKSDPYHALWRHLLDAFAVCEALIPSMGGVDGLADRVVCLFVALHDLGKADPEFQGKDDTLAEKLRGLGFRIPSRNAAFRHEVRSAEWLVEWLKRSQGWPPAACKLVGQAVTGHHGNFAAQLGDQEDETDEDRLLRDQLADLIRRTACVQELPSPEFGNASVSGMKLVALTVLSDWIASNDEVYPYPDLREIEDPEEYLHRARVLAREVVDRLGFRPAAPAEAAPAPRLFTELFPVEGPRPLQERIQESILEGDIPPGLVIIEDRMGQGKTEAALYISEEWRRQGASHGAYIGLPTEATSNQMHTRYSRFLANRGEGAAPRLIHGRAWLVEDDLEPHRMELWGEQGEGGDRADQHLARFWFRSTRRALLAEEGVGTVDQAMMAALQVKFGFLRLLGLSRKTLIIDEVHAYDSYMLTIIERLLAWCRALRIPVILLSATLSQGQKEALAKAYGAELPQAGSKAPYPLVTVAPPDGPARLLELAEPPQGFSLAIRPHQGLLENYPATAGLAVDLTRRGGCCCVLANTVAAAQEIYDHLRRLRASGALSPECRLMLYHARFTAARRMEIEREVIGSFGKEAGQHRPARAILVATQVVEQSLDVDFDVMITQLAPIDLLLQRAGRLHRHEREYRPVGPVPELHVLLPQQNGEFGATGHVYADTLPLVRTMPLVAKPDLIRLPEAFRTLIGQVYDPADGVADVEPELFEKAAFRQKELQSKAETDAKRYLLKPPEAERFAMARYLAAMHEEQDEDAPPAWFRASTRHGVSTMTVLAIEEGTEEAEWLRSPERPGLSRLRRLMLHQVSLPVWWKVDNGLPNPEWLRGRQVLLLEGGVAVSGEGLINNDPELGFRLEKKDAKEKSE